MVFLIRGLVEDGLTDGIPDFIMAVLEVFTIHILILLALIILFIMVLQGIDLPDGGI